MDNVFQEGVAQHPLAIFCQLINGDSSEWAGLTHKEYVNPVLVCNDPGLGEDFRIVQTWSCGYDSTDLAPIDVSHAEVRIWNPE